MSKPYQLIRNERTRPDAPSCQILKYYYSQTKDGCEKAYENVCNEYPPGGYSTMYKHKPEEIISSSGISIGWICIISHWSSCDYYF